MHPKALPSTQTHKYHQNATIRQKQTSTAAKMPTNKSNLRKQNVVQSAPPSIPQAAPMQSTGTGINTHKLNDSYMPISSSSSAAAVVSVAQHSLVDAGGPGAAASNTSANNAAPSNRHDSQPIIQFTCTICLETKDSLQFRALVPCGHTTCVQCLHDMQQRSATKPVFPCPECQQPVQMSIPMYVRQ